MATPVNAPAERCAAIQKPGTPAARPCPNAGRHFAQVDGIPRPCCAMHANGARKGSTRWQPLATWRATLETEPGRMADVPGWVRAQTGLETPRAIVHRFGEGATFEASGADWRAGEELDAAAARAEEESAKAWRELGPQDQAERAEAQAELEESDPTAHTVNGRTRTLADDRLAVLTEAADLEGLRFREMARTVDERAEPTATTLEELDEPATPEELAAAGLDPLTGLPIPEEEEEPPPPPPRRQESPLPLRASAQLTLGFRVSP